MKLIEMLRDVDVLEAKGPSDVEISSLAFNSRKVGPGSLYVAVPGTQVDGHDFINEAIEKGAMAVLSERFPESLRPNVSYVRIKSSSVALGQIASNFHGRPSERMKLVGVTGTNGKTTTATLLFRIFRSLGFNVGLLSTIRNWINEEVVEATHTTPDALQISELMRKMVEAGCTHCFMEVTSHAVAQNRVYGLNFSGGVFTNLTQDHLDYHKTLDQYFAAKKQFFDRLGAEAFALTNLDDERGLAILKDTKASKKSYSLMSQADFECKVVENKVAGLVLELDGTVVWSKLRGRFNAYNLLAAYGAALLTGADRQKVLEIIPQLDPIEGRFEFVPEVKGVTGIVDFAHTPDGLQKILSDVNEVKGQGGRLIAVVGCGGNKDKKKRPIMGRIAFDNSDVAIFTSDNPRSEDPLTIINEMQQGLPQADAEKVIVQPERRAAILKACQLAQPSDIVVVAGKGHEKYQVIKGQKIPFDDRSVLEEGLKSIH